MKVHETKKCPYCKHPDVKFIGRANVNTSVNNKERKYWEKNGKKTYQCSKCNQTYQYGR